MKLLARFRKAAALPFVLLLVALNVIVVVALLVYATTELQASRNSGQTEVARAIAQSGIDIAAGLIAANSTNNGFVTYQRIVTNVPGDTNPRLETKIGNVVATNAAMPWKTTLVTNPSVLHSGFLAGTDGVDLNFAVRGDPSSSSGFIAPRTNISGWANLSTNMFRMDWIYVYRSGSTNPVGRVAYWVDDESSKLNINYSGMTNSYDMATYTKALTGANNYYFPTNRPSGGAAFNARIWPLDMELGGIAGLSRTNAVDIIKWRGAPWFIGFRPYPSVLGTRIGTIGAPGGLAVTGLLQQSAMGFTATAYSREEERSYSTGKKRFDMLTNLFNGAPTNVIAGFQTSILADNPKFASKYNMPAFAGAAYDIVQAPSGGVNAAWPPPLYVRGAPVLNELSLKVTCAENSGNYVVDVTTDAELIILSQQETGNSNLWGYYINGTNTSKIDVNIVFNNAFGIPSAQTLNGQTHSVSWFKTYADNMTYNGPNDTNLSTAIATMSQTNHFTNSALPTPLLPTNVTVIVKYSGKTNQSIMLTNIMPASGISAPTGGQTNIYYLVAQPRSDGGYRGDPRFGVFVAYPKADVNTTNFSALGLTASIGSLNTANPTNSAAKGNWQPDDFAADINHPDLMNSFQAFDTDRGMANLTGSISAGSGFATRFAGIGWIGEVPITTTSGDVLGFSTPRLWGDGRPEITVNGIMTEYPPDWLMLDSLHMSPSSTNSSGAFESYGRVNANSLKTFFQTVAGSTTKGDTIMDSVIINARTKDWVRGGSSTWTETIPSTDTSRTNVLWRIQEMIKQRNSADTPYTTHFQFLADLAATNLYSTNSGDPHYGTTNPSWWFAPNTNNPSTNIYAATNTTDRRIESIVRSLNQKFTTHGNQFSIFSLGQALQVVNGKTNIVGETYLQAVYERAPQYDSNGKITNGPSSAAPSVPPMRQLYLRELRY